MKTNMTMGQRLQIGTNGQFGDPSDEQLRPFAVKLIEMIKPTTLTPEQVLLTPDLRESMISEFIADQKAKAEQAEFDAKAKAEVEAAEKEAKAKAEVERVRQAIFTLKGTSPEEQKKLSVTAWAKALANGEIVELPSERKHEGNDTCGAPDSVGCCDHTGEVSEWALLPDGSVLYGLCEMLMSVYNELYELSGKKAKVFLHSSSKAGLEAKATYRREREVPTRKFVREFATEHENQLPFLPEPKLGADGKHLCAMGGKSMGEGKGNIPCCDGNQVAARFPHQRGVVYGWCQNFAGAAWTEFLRNQNDRKAGGEGARFNYRLQSENTVEAGQKKADDFLRRQGNNAKLEELARGYAKALDHTVLAPYGDVDENDGHIVLDKCAAGKVGWGCCDGSLEVDRGSHTDGVVRGFCARSSKAMYNVWLAMKRANEEAPEDNAFPPDYLRTAPIEQAIQWADEYNDRHREPGSGRSPLGNKTESDSRRRFEQRKSRKSANSRAEYDSRPKPNEGSGDITRNFKKGNKNRGNR